MSGGTRRNMFLSIHSDTRGNNHNAGSRQYVNLKALHSNPCLFHQTMSFLCLTASPKSQWLFKPIPLIHKSAQINCLLLMTFSYILNVFLNKLMGIFCPTMWLIILFTMIGTFPISVECLCLCSQTTVFQYRLFFTRPSAYKEAMAALDQIANCCN